MLRYSSWLGWLATFLLLARATTVQQRDEEGDKECDRLYKFRHPAKSGLVFTGGKHIVASFCSDYEDPFLYLRCWNEEKSEYEADAHSAAPGNGSAWFPLSADLESEHCWLILRDFRADYDGFESAVFTVRSGIRNQATAGLGTVTAKDNGPRSTDTSTETPGTSKTTGALSPTPSIEEVDADVSTSSSKGLHPGAIAGIAIGGVVLLAGLLALGFIMFRRKRKNHATPEAKAPEIDGAMIGTGKSAPPQELPGDEVAGQKGRKEQPVIERKPLPELQS